MSRRYPRFTRRGIKVITHLILGLPGETTEDMRASVRYLAAHPVFGVKLQLLHVLEGTDLGTLYKMTRFRFLRWRNTATLSQTALPFFHRKWSSTV